MIRLVDILKESPDTVVDNDGNQYHWYNNKRQVSFFWMPKSKRTVIGDKGEGHSDLYMDIDYDIDGYDPKHKGRVFFAPKIITWYVTPPKDLIKRMVKDIEKKTKLRIFNNGYSLEVYNNPNQWQGYLVSLDDFVRGKIKLKESPDSVFADGKMIVWTNNRAIPFGYTEDKTIVVGEKGESHTHMYKMAGSKPPLHPDYSGRVFFAPKIVSTWESVPKTILKKQVKAIEKKLGLAIIGRGYMWDNFKKGRMIPLDDYLK